MTENYSGYQGHKDCPECKGKQTVQISGGSNINYSWRSEHCTDCKYRIGEKFLLGTSGQPII